MIIPIKPFWSTDKPIKRYPKYHKIFFFVSFSTYKVEIPKYIAHIVRTTNPKSRIAIWENNVYQNADIKMPADKYANNLDLVINRTKKYVAKTPAEDKNATGNLDANSFVELKIL